jgi:hypothetical protein
VTFTALFVRADARIRIPVLPFDFHAGIRSKKAAVLLKIFPVLFFAVDKEASLIEAEPEVTPVADETILLQHTGNLVRVEGMTRGGKIQAVAEDHMGLHAVKRQVLHL